MCNNEIGGFDLIIKYDDVTPGSVDDELTVIDCQLDTIWNRYCVHGVLSVLNDPEYAGIIRFYASFTLAYSYLQAGVYLIGYVRFLILDPSSSPWFLDTTSFFDYFTCIASSCLGGYVNYNYIYPAYYPSEDGHFMVMLSCTDAKENNEEGPRIFSINAYPNPFNHSTTISFSLPDETYLSIRVYDISGRLVRTFVSRTFDAGYHSVIWDGTDRNGTPLPGRYLLY